MNEQMQPRAPFRCCDPSGAEALAVDGKKRVPATISAITKAIRWAEGIMREIDRRWLVRASDQCRTAQVSRGMRYDRMSSFI